MIYLLQVSFCWIAFYLIYQLFLRQQTFFTANRSYLLGTLAVGLLIPMLATYLTPSPEVLTMRAYISEIVVGETITIVPQETSLWATIKEHFVPIILWTSYLVGMIFMLARFCAGLLKIGRLYRTGTHEAINGYKVVKTNGRHLPFSFMQTVYIAEQVPMTKHLTWVLEHEGLHIRQRHTIDILFVELCHIFFWFNPILIFYKKALKQSHEYLADQHITDNHNHSDYSLLLSRQSSTGLEIALTNNFFSSQIKNRITMMNKQRSTKSSLMRYMIAVPLLFGMVVIFASNTNASITTENLPNTMPVNEITSAVSNLSPVEFTSNEVISSQHTVNADTGRVDFFKVVEQMPTFQGCEDITDKTEKEKCSKKNLLEFVYSNLKYPQEARDKNIQGTCVVTFLVSPEGKTFRHKIIRDIEGGTSQAVLDMMKLMNEKVTWSPGMQRGRKVNVLYTLPIKFKLQDNVKQEAPTKGGTSKTDQKGLSGIPGGLPIDAAYFINGRVSSMEGVKALDPNDIASISVLKGDSAAKFDPNARAGVIKVMTKDAKEEEVLVMTDQRKVSLGGGDPIIKVDGKLVDKETMENLDPSVIASIKVYKGDEAAKIHDKGKEVGVICIETVNSSNLKGVSPKEVDQLPVFGQCEPSMNPKDHEKCSQQNMISFIVENLEYPASAKKHGVEGTVVGTFIVTESGRMANIEIKKSVSPDCDQAVRDVLKKMSEEQTWYPGKKAGESAAVQMTLPVKFKLEGDKSIQSLAVKDIDFFIFPVPADDIINVEYTLTKQPQSSLIQLINVQGKTVLTQKGQTHLGLQKTSLDIADLPAGVYYLRITLDGKSQTSKVVIK